MDTDLKKQLQKIANTIRQLSMEAVEKANSGHPGMPMGCAELGAYLYGHFLKHNPKNSKWHNRDRFVLSAGHGSMWLYSCLFLSGFKLSLEDIKKFRQLHSKTPGHPEYGHTDGVEATTGPLGQGVGNAVGMALGMKILEEKFNTDEYQVFNNKVVCIAGDGCLMEGVSSEVSSFAGHLKLDNLILIYDSNNICLDGPTHECFTEDTKARYRAYGWEVFEIDGYDFDAMENVFNEIRENQQRPVFIVAHTIIGKGAPTKANTHKAHGSPLGEEEVQLVKKELNLSQKQFYIPQTVLDYFQQKRGKDEKLEEEWDDIFRRWSKAHPEKYDEFESMLNLDLPSGLEEELSKIEMKSPIAGREASHKVLNHLAKIFLSLYGGSADLSGSDKTLLQEYDIIKPGNFSGRNFKYGVREFGMGTIVNGMSLLGFIRPFCGTFLTFSDYMRNSIRLAALSSYRVIYQFTHDSIFLGEDGPTHQSIEQIASLRAMPNLFVFRPGDSNEVKMTWIAMLQHKGPCVIILSRQALPELAGTRKSFSKGVAKGAYIVKEEKQKADFSIFATGSELSLAMDVAESLEKLGKDVRVVSFVCWELFEMQSALYKENILGKKAGKKISIEAAVDFGWHKYVGDNGITIAMETFGLSAPQQDLAQEFGFVSDGIVQRIISSK